MHRCLFFLFFLWRCIGVIRGTWSIDLLRKNTSQIFFFLFFHLVDFGSNVSTVKVKLRVTVHIYQKLAGPLTHRYTHTHTQKQFTFLSCNCSTCGTEDGEGGGRQVEAGRRGAGMLRYRFGRLVILHFSTMIGWNCFTICCIVLSDMSTARAHLPQNSHARSFLHSLEGWVIPAYLDVKLRTCYAKCIQVGRSDLVS